MRIESLLGHTAQLYRRVKRNPLQADAAIESFLRARKYLGAKDRQFIAELIYFLLRNYLLLSHTCSPLFTHPNIRPLLQDTIALTEKAKVSTEELLLIAAAYVVKNDSVPPWLPDFLATHLASVTSDELAVVLQHCRSAAQTQRAANSEDLEALAIRYSIAPWILQSWLDYGYTLEQIRELGAALSQPAPLTIRVNCLRTSRTMLQQQFAAEQWEFSPTPFSPHGLTTEKRYHLLSHPLYRSGHFEIQDEGSQLISFAVAPQPHWRVLDACAGAGGKSLHLAVLQQDRGSILATDTERKRLRALRKRALRAQFRSIETLVVPNSANFQAQLPYALQSLERSFDAVLVDAPCSATGRSRRSPATRWYTRESSVSKLTVQQLNILQTYAQCVAPNGILVYATCSLLPQENEAVVTAFLERNPAFEPDPLLPAFETYHIRLPLLRQSQWYYTLLPSLTGTDGFFVARMRRVR